MAREGGWVQAREGHALPLTVTTPVTSPVHGVSNHALCLIALG